jgi:ABC-type dipeptide transport system, periplasmic component
MMKSKMLKSLLVLGVMSVTIALGGCTGDKEKRESTNNDSQIVVGIAQDLEDSLDPHLARAAGTKEVLFNIFEGLVKPDSEGNLVPAVASEFIVSEDHKSYTFMLRENVKFHNGAEVTAEDVEYSIKRCADTSSGAPLVSAYSIIDSVEIKDEKTIIIHLTEPNVEFLAYTTTAIIPKDVEDINSNPIGTGPFKYVSRAPQENLIVERFEEYWGEKAHLNRVEFKVVADADMIVMSLKGGSVDMFQRLTSSQTMELGEEFTIKEGTMNLIQALYLNNAAEPFNDVNVRRALSYAVDPVEIIQIMGDGKGTEVGSSVFPAFKKYYLEELKEVYAQDIEEAKRLLEEAGYPNGFEMTITVPSNYKPHVDTAQVIREQLKEIGVTANIELIEWSAWLDDVYAKKNYESTVIGVDASTLTARALLERFTSQSGSNFTNFSNEKYDEVFRKATSTIDDQEQIKYYQELQTILTEEAANVYIQDMASLVAINSEYGGYTFYPLYVLDMSTIYKYTE